MPTYKVTKKGFFGGVLREPGHPRHGFVVTAKAIPKGKLPSWLDEFKEKPSRSSSKKPNDTTQSFMGEDAESSTADIETL
jgi:hypothetical protein